MNKAIGIRFFRSIPQYYCTASHCYHVFIHYIQFVPSFDIVTYVIEEVESILN